MLDLTDPPPANRPNRRERGLLLILAAVQFTHLVDFMIMSPLGPQFIRVFHITPEAFGILVSAYAFSASLSGLVAARFVDRFDRKRALLAVYGGFTIGTVLCAMAVNYWLLLLARIVTGGFGGVVAALVLAVVGDAFPYSRRGTAMGVVLSAFSVALIAGVPAGLFLGNALGWAAPFAVLGGLSAIVLTAAAFILPPLHGHLHAPRTAKSVGFWRLLFDPNYMRAYALTVALMLGLFMIVPYIATYLVANVGRTESELPYVYFSGGLTTLLTVPVMGRLSDRYGKLSTFRVVALLTVVPILVLTNLPPVSLAAALAWTTIFMVTTSGRMVPAQALITACATPQHRGSFMSVTASVQQMASGLGSFLGGLLLGTTTQAGPRADGHIPPLVGFGTVGFLSALFTLLSVVLAGRLRLAEGELSPADATIQNLSRPDETSGVIP
jgi:predicted MFS family arabinose efflux permease